MLIMASSGLVILRLAYFSAFQRHGLRSGSSQVDLSPYPLEPGKLVRLNSHGDIRGRKSMRREHDRGILEIGHGYAADDDITELFDPVPGDQPMGYGPQQVAAFDLGLLLFIADDKLGLCYHPAVDLALVAMV